MLTHLILSMATGVMAQEAPAKVEARWLADFDEAAAVAKKEGKDLLVDFTGSDWCVWCIRLHHEVFDHPEFVDGASGQFVLVALDFPNGDEAKAKVPHPERNQELAKKYGVRGFPTVLLMNPEGEVFGKSGYAAGGPTPWVKNLGEIRESGKKTLAELAELDAKIAAAKGEEQSKLLDDAIARLEALDEDSPFGGRLATIARTTYTTDADNAQGRKLKAVTAILKANAASDADYAVAEQLDPKNEKGLRERVVLARLASVDSEEKVKEAIQWIDELDALGPIHDPEVAKPIYINAAIWCSQVLQQPEPAKKYAKKAKDLGLDNPQLVQMLDQILSG